METELNPKHMKNNSPGRMSSRAWVTSDYTDGLSVQPSTIQKRFNPEQNVWNINKPNFKQEEK